MFGYPKITTQLRELALKIPDPTGPQREALNRSHQTQRFSTFFFFFPAPALFTGTPLFPRKHLSPKHPLGYGPISNQEMFTPGRGYITLREKESIHFLKVPYELIMYTRPKGELPDYKISKLSYSKLLGSK